MRARYYSPELKRFLNQDILLGIMQQPIAGIMPAMTKIGPRASFLGGRDYFQPAPILSDDSTHGPATPSSARPCQPKANFFKNRLETRLA